MTPRIMRHSFIVASLPVLTLIVASSPVQLSETERNYPLSQWEPLQQRSPLRDPLNNRDVVIENTENLLGLDKRYTYDCTDLKASFDSRCWAELDLTGYLTDPVTGWNHTARRCDTVQGAQNDDGADCCKPGEVWTTCFIRLAQGAPGQDCSQINAQFCSYQSTLDPNMDPAKKPKAHYVMKNIYGK